MIGKSTFMEIPAIMRNVTTLSFVRYRGHKILNDFITLDNALLAKAKCWI